MTKAQRFKEITFPDSRVATIDICELGKHKHHITVLFEVDVTDARLHFKRIKEQGGGSLSFTAWFVKCIGAAVSEYGAAASYLGRHNKILIPENVDISITVEKSINGYRVPLPYVIRNAEKKSVIDIHNEIRAAQNSVVDDGTVVIGSGKGNWTKIFYALPAFLRRWAWKVLLLKPRKAQQLMGSVIVTSLGSVSNQDCFIIPTSIHPLCFAVGGITKKPGVSGGTVAVREYLKLTVLIDHDVIDGAPVARFVGRLCELLGSGYNLEQIQSLNQD